MNHQQIIVLIFEVLRLEVIGINVKLLQSNGFQYKVVIVATDPSNS